jgi:hypothetical protein
MVEGRKRVIGFMVSILASLHLPTVGTSRVRRGSAGRCFVAEGPLG